MKKYTFETKNGKEGVARIEDALLDTQSRAQARARAEFLEGSYSKQFCEFNTYRTDIAINSIISVRGSRYKVIDVQIDMVPGSIISKVTGVRYAG